MARKTIVGSSVLYVGQIPYDWDEKVIKSVACGSGNIVDVRLGFDYAGKNKGFCFIEYQTPQDAQNAIGLLEQVKLVNPMQPSQYKKLRIELSKEGLRSNSSSDNRVAIPVDRNYLPSYVQLPQEMLLNGPPIPSHTYSNPPNLSHFQNTPDLPNIPVTYNNNNNNNISYNNNLNSNNNRSNTNSVNQDSGFPQQLTAATKSLPQPQTLPFAVSDKINETLSKIPPAQLIELIANLKNILGGPSAARAVDVFQISPYLATAAAQALLHMGLIDNDVMNESMKAATEAPPPPPIHNSMQNMQMNNPYGQPMQQPPQPSQPMSKWPLLPPNTQAKLAAMAPDQADLVAQVLALPENQIISLPPDKKSMVLNLRAQYL